MSEKWFIAVLTVDCLIVLSLTAVLASVHGVSALAVLIVLFFAVVMLYLTLYAYDCSYPTSIKD